MSRAQKLKDESQISHSSQAYVSLAQLTDGGEAYCSTLDLISLERRLDYQVADDAKLIAREEQRQPSQMSETRLREELQRRDLYDDKGQPRWALIIALEEAVRKESRILRLHQATTQVLIKPNKKNRNLVKTVIGESKKQYRQKRINARAAIHQQQDQLERRQVKKRWLFLSLSELDRHFDHFNEVDKLMVNDGIFILNMKKQWIHKRVNNIPLKPEVIDNQYMTCSPELYELLWRKEERGEVIYVHGESFTYEILSKKIEKITLIPREDDALAQKLRGLQLKKSWWARTWKKELPTHAPVFTKSTEKISHALDSNCFETFSLAEILYQSNPDVFKIWSLPSISKQQQMYRILKSRLPGEPGTGRNAIDWKVAEEQRKKEEEEIQKEEAAFWAKVAKVEPKVDEDVKKSSTTTSTTRNRKKSQPKGGKGHQQRKQLTRSKSPLSR